MEVFSVKMNVGPPSRPKYAFVQVLGTRIDEHFAWTQIPSEEVVVGAKRSTVTHLPTGSAVKQNVMNLGAAKRIVAKFRLLKQVDWGEGDLDELMRAVKHKRNAALLREALAYTGEEVRPAKAVPGTFAWLVAKPEWEGAQVVGKEKRPGLGDCLKIVHPTSRAVAYLLAGAA